MPHDTDFQPRPRPIGIPAHTHHVQVPLTTAPGASADILIAALIEWCAGQGIATRFSCQGGPPADFDTAYIAFTRRSGAGRFLSALVDALADSDRPDVHAVIRRVSARRRGRRGSGRERVAATPQGSPGMTWSVSFSRRRYRSAVYFPHADLLTVTQALGLADATRT